MAISEQVLYDGTNISDSSENSLLTLFLNATQATNVSEYDEYVASLKEQLKWTRFVVQKILVPIVVIFGVTGNVLNIAVLTQRYVNVFQLPLTIAFKRVV